MHRVTGLRQRCWSIFGAFDSPSPDCRILSPYSIAELSDACKSVVKANGLAACYIRPAVLRGYGAMGLDGVGSPLETYVPAWEWGAYLGGDEVFAAGIDCCTATWARAAPNTFPGMAKCAGNYVNATLIKTEAQVRRVRAGRRRVGGMRSTSFFQWFFRGAGLLNWPDPGTAGVQVPAPSPAFEYPPPPPSRL